LPDRESIRSRVSFDSRYGTCGAGPRDDEEEDDALLIAASARMTLESTESEPF
jgi:hypothetical protein